MKFFSDEDNFFTKCNQISEKYDFPSPLKFVLTQEDHLQIKKSAERINR